MHSQSAHVELPGTSPRNGMIFVPSGTFWMGSDRHYPEEGPAHRVKVDGFFIDETPVTNAQFSEFVSATNYRTFAEAVPDPADYPGILPEMLYAGSLVFHPPNGAVDPQDWTQWWSFLKGACWRHPYGPGSTIEGLDHHPVVHVSYEDALDCGGVARTCRQRPSGNLLPGAALRAPNMPGARNLSPPDGIWPILGRGPFQL